MSSRSGQTAAGPRSTTVTWLTCARSSTITRTVTLPWTRTGRRSWSTRPARARAWRSSAAPTRPTAARWPACVWPTGPGASCWASATRGTGGRGGPGRRSGWWFGTHFSGIASRAHPGWVLVSTYTEPRTQHYPFSREIFWLKLDGSGEVRRIAHHHSDQASHGGEKDYWAEPHATSSWDGDLVVFSSVWETPWENYDFYTCTGDGWD